MKHLILNMNILCLSVGRVCTFEYTLIILCKSQLLSVNLGNCDVYSSYHEPGVVVIYHCRITAPPSEPTSTHEEGNAADLISPSCCTYTVQWTTLEELQKAAKITSLTEITTVINVQSSVWQHVAWDHSIFFWWQCNTKHFSIAFTWMFRLANSL